MALDTLACKVDTIDKRTFSAIARAHDRCESAELRMLVRAYCRGQVAINPGGKATAPTEPAGQETVKYG